MYRDYPLQQQVPTAQAGRKARRTSIETVGASLLILGPPGSHRRLRVPRSIVNRRKRCRRALSFPAAETSPVSNPG